MLAAAGRTAAAAHLPQDVACDEERTQAAAAGCGLALALAWLPLGVAFITAAMLGACLPILATVCSTDCRAVPRQGCPKHLAHEALHLIDALQVILNGHQLEPVRTSKKLLTGVARVCKKMSCTSSQPLARSDKWCSHITSKAMSGVAACIRDTATRMQEWAQSGWSGLLGCRHWGDSGSRWAAQLDVARERTVARYDQLFQ